MTLILQRTHEVGDTTFGKLLLNDSTFLNYTLEDKIRKEKIKHQTAIPSGTYEVIINKSVRFKQLMPLLLNVPNFEGIRIHKGNTTEDTSGCIVVGDKILDDKVLLSTTAYQRLFTFLEKSLKKERVYIRVEDIITPIVIIPKPVELPKNIIKPIIIEKPIEVSIEIPVRETNIISENHTNNYKMDNNNLVQELILANLNVIQDKVLPLIEKEYARLGATVGLEKIKQTVLILVDEDKDNKAQLNLIWGTLTSDPQIVEAVKSALLTAISSVDDAIIKEGLTLLVEPLTQTLIATSDAVKPNGEQIKLIWTNFIKSPEFIAFVLANLETVIRLVIKNDNLEKILLSLLKVFGKL